MGGESFGRDAVGGEFSGPLAASACSPYLARSLYCEQSSGPPRPVTSRSEPKPEAAPVGKPETGEATTSKKDGTSDETSVQGFRVSGFRV